MTEFDSHTTRLTTPARAHSLTIYRDTPLTYAGTQTARLPMPGTRALFQPDEYANSWTLFGFAALTLPTVIYSLVQIMSLASSGSLEHAVKAFLP